MARKKGNRSQPSTSAPAQTVGDLDDDQVYSLTEQHRQKYERLLKAKKDADASLRNHCKIIKADLGKDGLSDIKDLIAISTPEGEARVKADMERQARVLRWMNIPIGTQGGLFEVNDPAPLSERAFNEGKRQGLAGETNSNPHHVTTEAHRAHNDGYGTGQEMLAKNGFKQAGNVPRDQWQANLSDQNAATDAAIRSGTLGDAKASHQIRQ